MSEKRKIVLVGTGFVGMSMAYSFLSTGGIDELVLLDVAKEKAERRWICSTACRMPEVKWKSMQEIMRIAEMRVLW